MLIILPEWLKMQLLHFITNELTKRLETNMETTGCSENGLLRSRSLLSSMIIVKVIIMRVTEIIPILSRISPILEEM